MNKRVTLKDIAKRCGVSAMTVSCVVRDIGCVSEKTRARVQRAIDELGYEVDPTLRALAAYRTQVANDKGQRYKASIAFLDSDGAKFTFAAFDHCAEEGRKLGYKLNYFRLPETRREQTAFSKHLWTLGIRGILLGPAEREFDLGGFQFDRFAIVGMGSFYHHPPVDSVSPDHFFGLYTAAQRCAEQGFQRIGFFLNSYLESRTGHRWLGAYHAFCHHYGQQPLILIYDMKQRPSDEEVAEWIMGNRIDAMLTLSTFLPPSPLYPNLRRVYLTDWNIPPGSQYMSTPLDLVAKESLALLNDHLIYQRFGLPVRPKQVSIRPVFQSDSGNEWGPGVHSQAGA